METAPQSVLSIEDPERRKKRGFWIWNIAISGVLMVVAPVVGLLTTVGGMHGAFDQMGTSGADVGALSNHIGEVLIATLVGLGVSVITFIWMVVSIVRLCTLPKAPPIIVRSAR